MKTILCFFMVVMFAEDAFAGTINVPGESAHAAGGMVVSGMATAIAGKYWPEHRALIGFGFSTACGIIGEGVDRAQYGEKLSSMLIDVAFHTIGAAIGAAITDEFILMPVMKRDHSESTNFGIVMQCRF